MPIVVDGKTYANVGEWNRAMDAQARQNAELPVNPRRPPRCLPPQ